MNELSEIAFKNARARFTASNGSVVQTLADFMLEVHYAVTEIQSALAFLNGFILPKPEQTQERRGDVRSQYLRDLAAQTPSLERANMLLECADIIDQRFTVDEAKVGVPVSPEPLKCSTYVNDERISDVAARELWLATGVKREEPDAAAILREKAALSRENFREQFQQAKQDYDPASFRWPVDIDGYSLGN